MPAATRRVVEPDSGKAVTRSLRARGEGLLAAGRPAEAAALFVDALAADPTDAASYVALGGAMVAIGQVDAAIELLAQAAAVVPSSGAVRSAMGRAQAARGDKEASVARHAESVAVEPGRPEGWGEYAAALLAAGRGEEALVANARAEALVPGHPELLYNRGVMLLHVGRPLEAEAALDAALGKVPNHARAHSNRAHALADAALLGLAPYDDARVAAIEAALRRALSIDPRLHDARWNLALHLLRCGREAEGLAEFEVRRELGMVPPTPGAASRAGGDWRGQRLDGGTLGVVAEQGLGDTVQFARYLARARERVGRLVLVAQKALAPRGGRASILDGIAGVDAIVGLDEGRPQADAWAPLMSLPLLLGVPLDDGAQAPYLKVDRARVASWRERLGLGAGLGVGLAWQGNPTYAQDRHRSLPLDRLAPLLSLTGARFVSLQKGHGREQVDALPLALRPLDPSSTPGPELDAAGAFVDTAAVLAGLDLLICSDSAIAHVAGAIGVETWLLLPHLPDWRWGRAGEISRLYPSMRLYRQRVAGNWDEVARRVAADLAERISAASSGAAF